MFEGIFPCCVRYENPIPDHSDMPNKEKREVIFVLIDQYQDRQHCLIHISNYLHYL